jgi:hypothetical protein
MKDAIAGTLVLVVGGNLLVSQFNRWVTERMITQQLQQAAVQQKWAQHRLPQYRLPQDSQRHLAPTAGDLAERRLERMLQESR